jgi:hypothetical protein
MKIKKSEPPIIAHPGAAQRISALPSRRNGTPDLSGSALNPDRICRPAQKRDGASGDARLRPPLQEKLATRRESHTKLVVMGPPPGHAARSFRFERDTFAFAHELVWKYRLEPVTGKMTVFKADPPPAYYHRCFVMVRTVRQFFYHARFDPGLPAVKTEAYRRLVRQIISRNPRHGSAAPEEQVVVPGYDGLRAFSQAHEPLLKAECGGAWQSYFLRSHWRMVFPTPKWHQEQIARQLARSLREGGVPLVHLFRFPRITINHGIVLFGMTESEREIQFEAYDPNIPEHPVRLVFDRAGRTFIFPPACYWAGGPLSVIEIFRGGLY